MNAYDVCQEPEKFAYRVELAAEDYSVGYVILTQKEADLVARVTNPDNWECASLEKYSGRFIIDNKFPISMMAFNVMRKIKPGEIMMLKEGENN